MPEKGSQGTRRVLIVEDSQNWRDLLPSVFKGIETVVVKSAKEAEEALKKGGFTEIVTDGLGGDWTQVVEKSGGLPVKLLSGDVRHKHLAIEKGVKFLDKGTFDINELLK
ncbi:MAG: hypothetical protein ABIJ85_02175 [bacterium]